MSRILFFGLVGSALLAALVWAGEVGIGPWSSRTKTR